MKFGSHCYLWHHTWDDSCLPILDRVKAEGHDIFEIPAGDDISFTGSLTRDRAASLGITLTVGPGGAWPVECDISSDDASCRAKGLAWHKKQVDVAASLGAAAYVGAQYGHPGVVRRRLPPGDEACRVAEGLHALAEHGARRGVLIVVEPMSHFRTHVVTTPQQAVALIGRAAHPNLKVCIDTYHMVTELRDYGAAIRATGGLLWILHACENDRGAPGGGLVPWDDIARALKDIAYDGNVMLESYNSQLGSPPGAFAHSRGMFHNVAPGPEEFCRKGIGFVKECFARNGLLEKQARGGRRP